MVSSCSAPGCPERANKGSKLAFHRFPAKLALREQWIKAIKKDKFEPTKNSRLCEKHFSPDCYLHVLNRKILKDDAVPSIFGTSSSTTPATLESSLQSNNSSTTKITPLAPKPVHQTTLIALPNVKPTVPSTISSSSAPTTSSINPINIPPTSTTPCILVPVSSSFQMPTSTSDGNKDQPPFRKVLPKIPGPQIIIPGLGGLALIPVIPKTPYSSPSIPNGSFIAIRYQSPTTSSPANSSFTTSDLIAKRKARNAYVGDFKSTHLSTISGRSEFIYKVTLLKKKYKQRLKNMENAKKQMKRRKAFLENLLIKINEKQLTSDTNEDDLMDCFLEEENSDSEDDSESDDESAVIEKMLDDSLAKLNAKSAPIKSPEEDEFMVFGMSIAALLRVMPEEQSEIIQEKIKELIDEKKKKNTNNISISGSDAFPGLENIEIID